MRRLTDILVQTAHLIGVAFIDILLGYNARRRKPRRTILENFDQLYNLYSKIYSGHRSLIYFISFSRIVVDLKCLEYLLQPIIGIPSSNFLECGDYCYSDKFWFTNAYCLSSTSWHV